MQFLRRLSVASSLTLALVGCSHPAQVIVLDQHSTHPRVGLTSYESEVCCMNYNYPGAALWLEHCYGPITYDQCSLQHFGHRLPCAPHLGAPRECQPTNCAPHATCGTPHEGLSQSTCPCWQPAWQQSPEHAPAPLGRSPASELQQPLVPEVQVLEGPSHKDPTPEDPALEDPAPQQNEPLREAGALDSAPEPPENTVPRKSRRRQENQREQVDNDTTLLPLNAANISEQSVEAIPQVQIPRNEVPQVEVPRNEIPELRLKLKFTSERVEAE